MFFLDIENGAVLEVGLRIRFQTGGGRMSRILSTFKDFQDDRSLVARSYQSTFFLSSEVIPAGSQNVQCKAATIYEFYLTASPIIWGNAVIGHWIYF
jgi:hypothetical protein